MKYEGTNRLMLITHQTDKLDEPAEARLFLEGGGTWVQLRKKEGLTEPLAATLARICGEKGAQLSIDDNLDVALRVGAGGVHLGKNDLPVDEAWRRVRAEGKEAGFLVGATANTFDDIRLAASRGASYIGLGPFRFTETKQRLSPTLGLEGYRHILGQCREAGIQLPVYAIGGIELADVPALMRTGITGVAISGAIVRAADPAEATRQFLEAIQSSL